METRDQGVSYVRDFYKAQQDDYKKNPEIKRSRGLGDTIQRVAKRTGVYDLIKSMSEMAGIDCGCEDRKDVMNKIFPYKHTE